MTTASRPRTPTNSWRRCRIAHPQSETYLRVERRAGHGARQCAEQDARPRQRHHRLPARQARRACARLAQDPLERRDRSAQISSRTYGQRAAIHALSSLVPADGGNKLDKAFSERRRCGDHRSQTRSRRPQGRGARERSAASFLESALTRPARPRLLVRVNALATGLTDADLDAVVPARPGCHHAAEGGGAARRSWQPTPGSPRARRWPASTTAHIRILAQAIETAAGIFQIGTFRGAKHPPHRPGVGAGGPSAELGAEANRDADGWAHRSPIGSRGHSACSERRPPRWRRSETVYMCASAISKARAEVEAARRDGFSARLAINQAQVPVVSHNRSVHPGALGRASPKGVHAIIAR